jgi:nucleoside-diphosphate-sugar epimerase
MDIYGKKVLVLGGWGLVGKAITRRLNDRKTIRHNHNLS